jgi:hypothetical protein
MIHIRVDTAAPTGAAPTGRFADAELLNPSMYAVGREQAYVAMDGLHGFFVEESLVHPEDRMQRPGANAEHVPRG